MKGSQPSESKAGKDEKVEKVENLAQALNLKKLFSANKMRGRWKISCWINTAERILYWRGRDSNFVKRDSLPPSLFLSSSSLVLTIPSMKGWQGKEVKGPSWNTLIIYILMDSYITAFFIENITSCFLFFGFFFAEVVNGFVATKWWSEANTTKTFFLPLWTCHGTLSLQNKIPSLCLFKYNKLIALPRKNCPSLKLKGGRKKLLLYHLKYFMCLFVHLTL